MLKLTYRELIESRQALKLQQSNYQQVLDFTGAEFNSHLTNHMNVVGNVIKKIEEEITNWRED